jgi:hypothetical protein
MWGAHVASQAHETAGVRATAICESCTSQWNCTSQFGRFFLHFDISYKLRVHVPAIEETQLFDELTSQSREAEGGYAPGAVSSEQYRYNYDKRHNLFERYAEVKEWVALTPETQETFRRLGKALRITKDDGPSDPRLVALQRLWSPTFSLAHGDLHGGNILIDIKDEVSLVDFAMVRELPAYKDVAKLETMILFKHTFLPLAPEDVILRLPVSA